MSSKTVPTWLFALLSASTHANCNSSIILFLLKGTGKEYPLRSVYTDEESCPIIEYKCKKPPNGNGKAYWEKLDGDTMNGKNVAFSKHDIQLAQ